VVNAGEVKALNESTAHTAANILNDSAAYLESDCDEQVCHQHYDHQTDVFS
jgi:hypothetical protein